MFKIINREKISEYFWTIFFCGIILISVTGGAISRVVIGNGAWGYYANYFCWFIWWVVYIAKEKKLRFAKEYNIIFGVIVLNTIIGALLGRIFLNLNFSNLHQGILTGLIILIVMGIDWNDYLEKKDIVLIMKVIFWIGIVASLYAMLVQNRNLIGVLKGVDKDVNTWVYQSFFGQRNVFAYFCFLSSVAGKYLLNFSKQRKYIVGMGILALQIYITDSRTAILALLLFYFLCLYLKLGKKEKIIIPFIFVVIAICVIAFMGMDALMGRFYHDSKTMYGDSGILRLNMWDSGIKLLISNHAILTGFGFGAHGPYLDPIFHLRSFHNAYMDIIFQGGIILFGIHVFLIICVIKKILNLESKENKYISLSFVGSFLIGCLFDSSAMLFASNYESVLATVMVCVLSKVEIKDDSIYNNSFDLL